MNVSDLEKEEWEATKKILSDKEKVKTQAKACGYQLKEKYFFTLLIVL